MRAGKSSHKSTLPSKHNEHNIRNRNLKEHTQLTETESQDHELNEHGDQWKSSRRFHWFLMLSIVMILLNFIHPVRPGEKVVSLDSCRGVPSPPLFPEFDHYIQSRRERPFCRGHLKPFVWKDRLSDHQAQDLVDEIWEDCESGFQKPVMTEEQFNVSCENADPWLPAPFQRLVLFIMDAFRFDWMAWNPKMHDWYGTESRAMSYCDPTIMSDNHTACKNEHFKHTTPPKRKRPRWSKNGENNFPVPHHLLSHPVTQHHSRLFRSIADFPTYTVTRIEALMAGTIPPSFSSATMFHGWIKVMDSVLHQLNQVRKIRKGKPGRATMAIGETLWHTVFKNMLSTEFLTSGHDIQNNDKTDEAIHQLLWKALYMMKNNRTDLDYLIDLPSFKDAMKTPATSRWMRANTDLLIAHNLELDALCHLEGTESLRVHSTLRNYNLILGNIVNILSGGSVGHNAISSQLPPESNWNASLPLFKSSLKQAEEAKLITDQNYRSILNYDSTNQEDWMTDTVFVTMGDHGTNNLGEHGFTTKHEAEAGMFAWVPSVLIPGSEFSSNKILKKNLWSEPLKSLTNPIDPGISAASSFHTEHKYDMRSIRQIDFAATLALLIGVPLPQGNFGNLIPELIPLYRRKSFWIRYDEEAHRATHSIRRDGNDEMIPSLACLDTRTDKTVFVIWPIVHTLDGRIANQEDQLRLCNLECEFALKTDQTKHQMDNFDYLKSSKVKIGGRNYPISRLSWARHIRYLITWHHHIVWTIRRNSRHNSEALEASTERIWQDLKRSYAEVIGNTTNRNDLLISDLFSKLERYEDSPNDAGEAAFIAALNSLSRLNRTNGLETHIQRLERLLDTQRKYINYSQDATREVLAREFKSRVKFLGSVLAMSILVTVLLVRTFGRSEFTLKRRRGVVCFGCTVQRLSWIVAGGLLVFRLKRMLFRRSSTESSAVSAVARWFNSDMVGWAEIVFNWIITWNAVHPLMCKAKMVKTTDLEPALSPRQCEHGNSAITSRSNTISSQNSSAELNHQSEDKCSWRRKNWLLVLMEQGPWIVSAAGHALVGGHSFLMLYKGVEVSRVIFQTTIVLIGIKSFMLPYLHSRPRIGRLMKTQNIRSWLLLLFTILLLSRIESFFVGFSGRLPGKKSFLTSPNKLIMSALILYPAVEVVIARALGRENSSETKRDDDDNNNHIHRRNKTTNSHHHKQFVRFFTTSRVLVMCMKLVYFYCNSSIEVHKRGLNNAVSTTPPPHYLTWMFTLVGIPASYVQYHSLFNCLVLGLPRYILISELLILGYLTLRGRRTWKASIKDHKLLIMLTFIYDAYSTVQIAEKYCVAPFQMLIGAALLEASTFAIKVEGTTTPSEDGSVSIESIEYYNLRKRVIPTADGGEKQSKSLLHRYIINNEELVWLCFAFGYLMFNVTGQNTSFNRFPMGAGRTGLTTVKLPLGLILIVIHMGAAGIATPVFLSYAVKLRKYTLRTGGANGLKTNNQQLVEKYNALIKYTTIFAAECALTNLVALFVCSPNEFPRWVSKLYIEALLICFVSLFQLILLR